MGGASVGRNVACNGFPPYPSPLWVYAGVGAHGGAPNVAAPPALEWERGQGERGKARVLLLYYDKEN
jgi:hypothetical protein